MRLSMDEVRKQHDGIKKLYEQGLRGATASVEQVLDLFDTIEALQQENEQLRAQLDEWKYEAKCHMDEVVARDKEIEKLRAHVARMRDALQYYADVKRWGTVNLQYVPTPEVAKKALAEIDKAIGGKEDEK